ncbi:MAG: DNA-protecting protein DprA [Clostridia bacterium]|nr:DNA-protecting protein DprA [Clostridia bacterium]
MEPKALYQLSDPETRDALDMDDAALERIGRLLNREASLAFALNHLQDAGVYVVTRTDAQYPRRLKAALGNTCPPLFYYAGDLSLLDRPAVGYAGSRLITEEDLTFTRDTVAKTVRHGFIVVSGGAKGVDSTAETAALEKGSAAVSFLSDSLLRKIKVPQNLKALQKKNMLLLSAVNPDAGFHAGTAMMRNRYIYIQSQATVVVKSDYNKGGTWSGAVESLKHQWAPVLCRNQADIPGNQALINQGAIPIDSQWDGDVNQLLASRNSTQTEQLSMFS